MSLHEAGDVFFESEDEVHKIANPSATETAEALITFIVPVGSGVAEYWLVDPRDNEISTWRQDGDDYLLLGRARPGDRVVTEVLSGLELDPGSVLDER